MTANVGTVGKNGLSVVLMLLPRDDSLSYNSTADRQSLDLDCNYTFPIDLAPNRILFDTKSTEKAQYTLFQRMKVFHRYTLSNNESVLNEAL